MAVTKTHPIKSTLKAAIDYILNPEKTDGKLLASSFGCGLETADIEFAWTREAAGDRGTHLGRYLIQSFAVGETTPEEAHKIGMELAGAVLGGKYEFVLTTHVDKDHLHNHLIFNSVSFVDYKKYHSNKQSYYHIRRTSDRICKEHGLSVVVPGQDRGKSYAEYTAEKQGTSYKAKLKTAIDNLIPRVKDFDELLRRLQEMGYEIKQGKYISFRAAGQERFTRTKTLGAAYTEEAIKERIKGVYVAKTKTLREDKKIRLVVDLENSIKAQQSAGYERWAKIHNLKQAAKSMNFLTENKIEYYSELESKIADIMTAHDAAAKAVKEVEQRMSDLSLLIKHTTTYRQLKPIYDEYRKSPDKEKYGRVVEPVTAIFTLIGKKMAFVSVPKDLTKVKNKVVLNLTKRQLLCLSIAAAVGLPFYFLTKDWIGTSNAATGMVILMVPAFLFAMYEKDGMPLEKILFHIIQVKLQRPAVRKYEIENFYEKEEVLQTERKKKGGKPDGRQNG